MPGVLLLALAGCTSATDDSGAPAATFTEIHTTLFPQATPAKCDFCHGQPASQVSNGLLNMGSDDRDAAYAAIIGQTSTSRDCAGQPYVVPGDPEASLFYVKLLDDPGCGERMPLGGGNLPADQIEMVRSWIAAGALDD
jgi:hypothetical protein